MTDDKNFNFDDFSKHTPLRKIPASKFGTPLDYSNVSFPNSIYNESNQIKVTDITDEFKLRNKFDSCEKSIEGVCKHYVSLEKVFNEADNKIKNKLLEYVLEFNEKCKNILNKKADDCFKAIKDSDEKNKLKENLNQKTEDYKNLERKYHAEKEEIKSSMSKEIQELKFKLKDAEDKIKKFKYKIEENENKLKENEKKILSIREEFGAFAGQSDYISFSYYLGDTPENKLIKVDSPTKKDYDQFISKFEKAENNFNIYTKMLVDTSNKALEKFKYIYKKIKGKDWIDLNNSFMKVHNFQTYNINQDLNWTNISNIHQTINAIINEIFELVNPTKNCDAKKLNEDSCDFLLNYIKGLKKLFFLQKEILDKDVDLDLCNKEEEFSQEKNKLFVNLKNLTNEIENFFKENGDVLSNQTYFEKFKEELNVDNTKNMMVDEYIKNIKSVFQQAKSIADKGENDFINFKKELNAKSKRNKIEDIEMELSNNKNRNINDNNNMN